MAIDTDEPVVSPTTGLDLTSNLTEATEQTGGLLSDLNMFSQTLLTQPSRYDIPLVQEGIGLINQEYDTGLSRGSAAMDELSSSRGLVGSNIELWNTKDMLVDLERVRSQKLFDLGREFATTVGGDRAMAAQTALQAANLGMGHQQFLAGLQQRESEFSRQFGMNQDQFAANLAEQMRQFDITTEEGRSQFEQSLFETMRQFDITTEEGRAQFEATMAEGMRQFNEGLAQQESEFARSLNISQQEVDLRAQALLQEAEQFGRTMTLEEARFEAEMDLAAQRLQLDAEQFGRSMTLEEARFEAENQRFEQQFGWEQQRFAAELGLSQEQLQFQYDEMNAQFEESARERLFTADQSQLMRDFDAAQAELDRLQAMGMQESDQEFQAAQAELDRIMSNDQFRETLQHEESMERLRARNAYELQQAGLDTETAWREADRLLTEQLENRALDLRAEELGISREALDLQRDEFIQAQAEFEQRLALEYEQLNMSSEQFYASLDQDQNQFLASLEENQRQFNDSLSQDQLQFQQSLGLEYDQMLESARQFDLSSADQRAQFEASLTAEQQQFWASLDQNQTQFIASLGEDQRQFDASLTADQEQFFAALSQEDQQFLMTLTEQQRQFNTDDAYRRAVLEQDNEQFTATQDLQRSIQEQEAALAAWDIYMRALSFYEGDMADLQFPDYPSLFGDTENPPPPTSNPFEGYGFGEGDLDTLQMLWEMYQNGQIDETADTTTTTSGTGFSQDSIF